jgi:hypothetical protein
MTCALSRHRTVHTPPSAVVTIIDVLEHRVALPLIDLGGVRFRKPLVKYCLDGHADLGAGLLSFPPIQDKLFPFERLKKLSGRLLHLCAILLGELHLAFSEEAEDREFLLAELLTNRPLLLRCRARMLP